ncbi:MAG: AAA family ATPase, partial [Bacteroides sp.]|nr:AAA family ATPase [Bacteroides sp.]
MNEQQSKYFHELREIHSGLANSLNNPRLSGVHDVISNLYRDDAHFVYELLQNADDQGATYTKFILCRNELIFIHNAPRLFTITDPATHVEDHNAGKLGDINSILSIASSSKANNQEEVKIGKFGLGFKSVFRFTDEPEIYDKNFRFSITDMIVPNLILNDHPRRQEDETLFRFRFRPGEESDAYKKINEKLRSLVNPILFLTSLKTIDWETEEESGYYKLEEIGKIGSGKRLRYEVMSEDAEKSLELWKFDASISEDNKLFVSVVYALEDGELATAVQPLYCYLPTANNTGLPVILHAPFKLTGNRESIIADDSHNKDMIARLSKLLVKSLREICEIGQSEHTPWIKDNILNFLPKQEGPQEVVTAANLNIEPLTHTVLDALKFHPMLWSEQLGRYLLPSQAFLPDNSYLAEVYTPDLLSELYGGMKGWVLPSLISEIRKSAEILRLTGVERLTPEKILRRMNPAFLNKRTMEWLKIWYRSLLKVPNFWERGSDPFLRFLPIVKTTKEGVCVAPYLRGKNTPNVCFTTPGVEEVVNEGVYLIPEELTEDEEVKLFFKRLGITGIDSFTMAEKIYLPKINSEKLDFTERLQNLIWLIGVYNYNLTSSQQKIIKAQCQLPGYYSDDWHFCAVSSVKVHNEDNDFYFAGLKGIPFFEKDKLPVSNPEEASLVEDFIKGYDAVHSPSVYYEKCLIGAKEEHRIPSFAQRPGFINRGKKEWEHIQEPSIVGFNHFLNHAAASDPKRASELIERLFVAKHGYAKYYSKLRRNEETIEIDPLYKRQLREAKWIELATPSLRKWLDLPVKELQGEGLDTIKSALSDSGIVSQEDVASLLAFMEERGVLKDFQLKQSIEEQKTIVSAVNKCSLRWFLEILELRLKYVASGEKKDIEFLITRLKEALDTVEVDEDTDLREVLPDNLNIIFGPPGTGKTTEIVNIVESTIKENPNAGILILTPTNAAAKVVAERLNSKGIEASRGVNPSNKEICDELAGLDIPVYDAMTDTVPAVLVATVHYYVQTYSSQEGCYLHDLDWDAIFIDETSMVTLDYVMFTLLKGSQTNPNCKYYLVGDPLQLPPITNLDPMILEEAQLDEFNFYSFIGLNEFNEEPTEVIDRLGDKINIRLLTTQYRSERPLCEIMSKFAYNGKVKSGFAGEPLHLPD